MQCSENMTRLSRIALEGVTVILALVAAVIVPALFIAMDGYVIFVALAHAIFIGLPVFVICRWCGWTQWWVSIVGGFMIGILPVSILVLHTANAGLSSDDIYFMGVFGLMGMAGGFSAWLVWKFFPVLVRRALVKFF